MAAVEIRVRVQPRAKRAGVARVRGDGVVLLRVTAPPVEGKANEAVRRLVAESAGVPRRSVSIARAERSRDKVVRVEGVEEDVLLSSLGGGGRGT